MNFSQIANNILLMYLLFFIVVLLLYLAYKIAAKSGESQHTRAAIKR